MTNILLNQKLKNLSKNALLELEIAIKLDDLDAINSILSLDITEASLEFINEILTEFLVKNETNNDEAFQSGNNGFGETIEESDKKKCYLKKKKPLLSILGFSLLCNNIERIPLPKINEKSTFTISDKYSKNPDQLSVEIFNINYNQVLTSITFTKEDLLFLRQVSDIFFNYQEEILSKRMTISLTTLYKEIYLTTPSTKSTNFLNMLEKLKLLSSFQISIKHRDFQVCKEILPITVEVHSDIKKSKITFLQLPPILEYQLHKKQIITLHKKSYEIGGGEKKSSSQILKDHIYVATKINSKYLYYNKRVSSKFLSNSFLLSNYPSRDKNKERLAKKVDLLAKDIFTTLQREESIKSFEKVDFEDLKGYKFC